MIRMLKDKTLRLIEIQIVFTCLRHLIENTHYAWIVFIELEGLDEVEWWINHSNLEVSGIASRFEEIFMKYGIGDKNLENRLPIETSQSCFNDITCNMPYDKTFNEDLSFRI
jgi:hypothetical protein